MMVISWDLQNNNRHCGTQLAVKNCPNFAIETMWVELEVIQKRTFQKARRLFLDIQGDNTGLLSDTKLSLSTGDQKVPFNDRTSVLNIIVFGQENQGTIVYSSTRDTIDFLDNQRAISPAFSTPGVDSNGLNSSNSTSNWISVRFGENCFDIR